METAKVLLSIGHMPKPFHEVFNALGKQSSSLFKLLMEVTYLDEQLNVST